MSLQKDIGFIEVMEATSVRLGSILVPPSTVESLLTRYVRQIFLVNEWPDYPYSICGSGTAVRHRGNHFVFCCQHQFSKFSHDQVATVCRRDKNYLLSASNIRVPKLDGNNDDEEYIDACGFHYKIDNYGIENLESEFFPLDDQNLWPFGSKDKYIVIGYPTYEQNIDLPERIDARVVIVSGKYAGRTNARYVHRICLERSRHFDCDGMSGGAVFYLGNADRQYFIGLAGMIVRGSSTSEILHFIEADLLKTFCDQAFNTQTDKEKFPYPR